MLYTKLIFSKKLSKHQTNSVMIKKITCIALFLSFTMQHSSAQNAKLTEQLGNIKLEFALDKSGTPEYAVYFKDQPIIKPSALGFNFKNNDAFNNHFKVL